MAASRVTELRTVMEKFAEFYNQKLCETEEIPNEPHRVKTKCRVLEHYVDDVKMQIEHFLTCVEKLENDSTEKMDRMKRTLRDNVEKVDFVEKQLHNSESQREQVELALRELGVRCESLEKNQRQSKHHYDSIINEIARLADAISMARVNGKLSELGKCQVHVPEMSRLMQAILSLESMTKPSCEKSPHRSFGVQIDTPESVFALEKQSSDDDLMQARRENTELSDKLRELRSSLNSVNQREQELVRELHARDREIARIRSSAHPESPSKMLQQRLEIAENERSEWKSQADLYHQQLTKAFEDMKKLQSEVSILAESETSVAYLQRELINERDRCEGLEISLKDRENEIDSYRSRYESIMMENDRIESLLAERRVSSSEQDNAYRNAMGEREEAVEQMRKDLVQVTQMLKDQRDKARAAEEQVRLLTSQLDAVKTFPSMSFSSVDSETTAGVTAEQFFAKELNSKTQILTDAVRKLEMQLETTRHEKIVLEEEFARLKSRSAAEQSALQHHVDRVKDELRAQEQAANKMRADMRAIWEEKLKTEQQIRELLDTQAVDHERNKTLNSLLQQREEEATSLRSEVANLSEQMGEKDGIISQLRAEIGRFDAESLALQRDAENTCELVRVRDNQILELRAAFERSCEAADNAKQELLRCEVAMKRMADELSDIRQKAADARMEAERERTRAVAAETQVAKLDSDRLFADQQLANAESEVSRLRNEVIELNDKTVALDRELAETRRFYEQLKMDNYEISVASDRDTKERRLCEARLGDLEMTTHMLEEQLQAYKQDVSVRDQAILRLRAETDQAIARCQSAQEEMEAKDADCRRISQRAREQQMELRQTLDNLAAMEDRLACAEARIAEVSQEREVAIQDARNTEFLIEQLKRDAQLMRTEQESETAKLKQANDILVVERDAVRADLSEVAQRLEHAREEIMSLCRSNSDMQVEIHQLSARCRQAELLVAEQNSTISDMRQRLAVASDEQENLQDEERRANMELETLRDRCSDLTERLASAESRYDEADRLSSDMKMRVADLELIVIRMEADLQQHRTDLRASRSRAAELDEAVMQMREIIETERLSAESVTFRLQAEEIVSRDLKEKLTRVCQDNTVLEESHSRLLADFRCFETDHRYSNGEVIERDKRIEDLEAEIEASNCAVVAAQRKVASLEEAFESIKTELLTAREEKRQLQHELGDFEKTLMAVRQQAESQSAEWENACRSREKEVDELRRQLNEANTDSRLAKEEIETHLERIHSLEIDIAATTSDLHQREDIIGRLECGIQEIRVELDSSRAALRESEARVNLMLSEVETAKREASDARQAQKQAVSEQAAAQQKAQVAEERATVSENEMNSKVAECVRLEGQVRRFQNELRSMQERLQDAEEDRSNLRDNLQRTKTEMTQTRDSISRLTQENGTLRQQIAKAEMELCGIREQHKLSAEQISHQEQILAQMQEDLRQERAKNVEASRGAAESRRVAVELRESLSNSERAVRELQNRLASRDHAVEDVQRELTECQAKLKSARDEVGEMEAQLRSAKVSHASAEREAQTVNERVFVLEKKAAELMADLDRTRDSLRSAQSVACEREQDAVNLQNELVRTRNQAAELAAQMNDLNRQLGLAQHEASRLRDVNAMNSAQLTKAEEYTAAIKSQMDSQKGTSERVRELQTRLAESEQKLTKAQSEADTLRAELEQIRTKYEESIRDVRLLKEALVAEQKENQSKSKAEAAASLSHATRISERQREQSHVIAKISAEKDQLGISLRQAESLLNDKETKIAEMRSHINEQDQLIRDLVSQCAKSMTVNNTRNGDAKTDKASTSSAISSATSSVSSSNQRSNRPTSPPMAPTKLNGNNGTSSNSSGISTSAVNSRSSLTITAKEIAVAAANSRIPVAVGNGQTPVAATSSPRSKRAQNQPAGHGVRANGRHTPDKQHQ